MGLFDRFKKKTTEEELQETVATPEETVEDTASTAKESREEQEQSADPEAITEELKAAPTASVEVKEPEEGREKRGTISLNQQLAQGIFNESLALYQEMDKNRRKEDLRVALITLTNDPLSESFLDASAQGMTSPERVANNISKADETTCRLALVQLASEGEKSTKEERMLLGKTQTALFLRILELNPDAGTSQDAQPKKQQAKIDRGETPEKFFNQEVLTKTTEMRLNDAQKALGKTITTIKELEEVQKEGNDPEPGQTAAHISALRDRQEKEKTAFESIRAEYVGQADTLASMVTELETLYVTVDANIKPEMPWISHNGHTEFYTDRALAEQVQNSFTSQGILNMQIKELQGNIQIVTYIKSLLHLGVTHVLLDNGRTPLDLRLKSLVEDEEKNLVDYANRACRFLFLRAKGYGMQYSKLTPEEQQGENGLKLRDHLLTMLFNAYRELGMGISYTLMVAEPKSGVTRYTPAAYELGQNLLKGAFKGHELVAGEDRRSEIYDGSLSIALIKKARNSVAAELEEAPSLLPVFSDYASAKVMKEHLVKASNAHYEIVAITWDELKVQAENYAGLVYDPEFYGLQIPKEDFPRVEEFRKVRGRIVINQRK